MTAEKHPLVDKVTPRLSKAPWTAAIPSSRNGTRHLPQAVAHRGYKALYPENSMAAFRGAVEVGAHGLETDTHLSADGVVVLSHDPSLKRCFGVDKKVDECDWDYLSTLRTLKAPHEGLPRLKDLLQWLCEPGLEKIWVLLDIKVDDDASALMAAIAKTFSEVQGPVPWESRIVLGCWSAKFIYAARTMLPSFPICHISFSPAYSWYFFPIPNIGFNLARQSLLGPLGRFFMRRIHAQGRRLYVWTVNEERWMEWCIKKNLGSKPHGKGGGGGACIDAIITDDPKLYLQVCERYEDELDGKRSRKQVSLATKVSQGMGTVLQLMFVQTLIVPFFLVRVYQGKFHFFSDRRTFQKL